MSRYFTSQYTDGPSTSWNVIDRQTQEWIRRFPTEREARDYIEKEEMLELFRHWQRAADKLQNDLRTSAGFDTRASELTGKTFANVREKTEAALARS